METTKLTVRLPTKDLEFAKQYAKEHRMTVTELIDRFLRSLQTAPQTSLHPAIERMSGLVPPDVDAEALYHEDRLSKHR